MDYGRCLLADCLRKAGMRQTDIADKLGARKQEVSAYVRGQRKMSLLTAVKYAEALHCDVTDLYEFPGLKRKEKEAES